MTALAGMVQTITFTRRGADTDSEGRPSGAPPEVATVAGLVTELSASEQAQGDALGEETTARAVVPSDTDVRSQDEAATTFPSGRVGTYRVVAVHDAVEALLLDLHSTA